MEVKTNSASEDASPVFFVNRKLQLPALYRPETSLSVALEVKSCGLNGAAETTLRFVPAISGSVPIN